MSPARPVRHRPVTTARLVGVLVLGVALASLAVVVPSVPPPPAAAAEPRCTISAKLVNSCRAWLGAESGNYGVTGFRARMLEHEARIGRQVDVVHAYLGQGPVVLTSDMRALATREATIAMVNWKVSNVWAQGDGRNPTVNGHIDAMANSVKSLGSTRIMLTIHHEPEDDVSAGGDPNCPNLGFNGSAGSVTDYVNMWRNVRARFDALGVDNVVWVMNYMGYPTWNCAVAGLWPGNYYVDWVMWDPYPKNTSWTTRIGAFYDFLTVSSDAEHDYLAKAWGLAEFGYVGSSQPAAYAMYDEARRNVQTGVHPRLKAYVVWDNWTSSSNDDRVGYTQAHVADPVEQQHYNDFANDSLLQGTAVPEPEDQVAPVVHLVTPREGDEVSGVVEVTGTATDETEMDQVYLLVDGEAVHSAPPSNDGSVVFSWNSAAVSNGSHELRLSASDASGNTALSEEVQVTVANVDDEAPQAPATLTATWSRPSQVSLVWSEASDNAAVTGYRVYRNGGPTPIASLGAEARGHVDLGVSELVAHTYEVTAVDAAGNESLPGARASAQAGDETPPSVPGSVRAVVTGAGEVTVTWTESTDAGGVAGYRVLRDGSLVDVVADGSTRLVEVGLTEGGTYAYRVVAYDAADNASAPSDAASVTVPDVTAPSTPLDLRAGSGTTSVPLTWRASSDNIGVTGYVVYRDGLPVASPAGTATAWTDTAPVGQTRHRYRITARDAAGNESGLSNEVERSLVDVTPPGTAQLSASRTGFTVRLTWTPASDDTGVVGYDVYRGGTLIGTTTGSPYTDSTPPLNQSSTYTVRAKDAAGNVGAASNPVTVAVPRDTTAPSRPTGLTATPGATGTRQITVRWNASTDNSRVQSYYLYRGNAKYRLLSSPTTSFVDTGLTAGTKYTYKVYAIDAAGLWSPASSSVSATAR